jgi:hypothetical protein
MNASCIVIGGSAVPHDLAVGWLLGTVGLAVWGHRCQAGVHRGAAVL